jgi:hypothetical protein
MTSMREKVPLRSLPNAILRPSGDQAGPPELLASLRTPVPSEFMTYTAHCPPGQVGVRMKAILEPAAAEATPDRPAGGEP